MAVGSGSEQTRQSILRRLCTNAGGYIWQLEYGAGLPARVGDVMNEGNVRTIVLAQMQNEAGVDQTQPVNVAITTPKTGAYLLAITYTDAQTGTVQELTLAN